MTESIARHFPTEVICEIHRRFCELLPPELLLVKTGEGDEKVSVEPGAIRTRDVKVGRHVAISPGSVPRFLSRMERGYKTAGRIDRILIAACGHHRLLWVHPFLDGNGRVARLVSHAALRSSLTKSGLWSLARGLARRENEYRTHLASCDEPRRGSLDGRGTLSEGALADFAKFFLEACIDQVDFMSGLMHPQKLRDRVLTWAQEEIRSGRLPPGSEAVLTAILYRGELERGEIAVLIRASDRSARRLTAALIRSGVVRSEPSRSTFQLAFPIELAMKFLPGLFRRIESEELLQPMARRRELVVVGP
ncbi:Fic family protein [Rhizobium leguminosarum]|uniref:Fic family protein n=1 Tax=Rhizobium leguminosarum TaxID=384 RepID=UPI003A94EAC5